MAAQNDLPEIRLDPAEMYREEISPIAGPARFDVSPR